ncbi:MAG: hypothetical protein H0V17_26140 [Deltaproteobacteria bacterium]|nr:hypothetical protein [Deltaproteobacteria bacterium]
MVRLVPALLLAVGITACALFSDGPPENFCRSDADCFRAQGEVCDVEAKQCVLGDGGVPDAPVDAVDANDAVTAELE